MRLELSPEFAAILFDALDDADYYRNGDSESDDLDEYDERRLEQYALLREEIDRQGNEHEDEDGEEPPECPEDGDVGYPSGEDGLWLCSSCGRELTKDEDED